MGLGIGWVPSLSTGGRAFLTGRQQHLHSAYEHPEVQPPRSRTAARPDPRRGQRAVRRARLRRGLDRGHRGSAGVARGLVHHYFGGRKEVYIGLLERLGAVREEQLAPPVGRSARARVANSVTRWLGWTEANRTIWLAAIAPGEDIVDPDVRRVVAGSCGAPSRWSRLATPTSRRTRRGCATRSSAGPRSTAPRRAAG